jgi:hypothetical protein
LALGTASVFVDLGRGGGPVLVGLAAGIATIPIGLVIAALVAALGAAGANVGRAKDAGAIGAVTSAAGRHRPADCPCHPT